MVYKQSLTYLLIICLISLFLLSCDNLSQERNKPIICFTFDDGHLNAFQQGYPLFLEYGYPATSFINSGWIGRPTAVSWENINELCENNWEIGGHTVDHAELMELSYDEAYYQIIQDYNNFQEKGIKLTSFALPAGHAHERDYTIIKSIYKNIRTSIAKEIYTPLNRYDLGYFAYQTGYTAETVKQRIRRGEIKGEVLIIIGFHRIGTDEENPVTNCTPQDLREILAWIAEHDFEVMRLNDAVDKILRK